MAVNVERQIAAPIDRIWELVSDFAGLQRWNPTIGPVEMQGEGVGAVRTVRSDAGSIQERLETCDARTSTLSYSVVACDMAGPNIVGMVATIALFPTDVGTSVLWRLDRDPPLPEEAEQILETYLPARIEHLSQAVGGE